MAESMKDYETELEASFKKIEEGDILTGTVISVDEKEVVVDLKYYAEGIIPAEDYSREPGFSLKEQVNVGDEVSATVVSKDDGNGNILLSRTEAADVLAWDKLKELKDSKDLKLLSGFSLRLFFIRLPLRRSAPLFLCFLFICFDLFCTECF